MTGQPNKQAQRRPQAGSRRESPPDGVPGVTRLRHRRPAFPVMVAEAPEGVPATVLGALHDRVDLSTVVFPPSTGLRDETGLAYEVIQALGKTGDVRGKSRHSSNEVGLVPQWLTAHRTELLILTACQRTNADILAELIDMCAPTPTALLLAVDYGYGDRMVQSLKAHAPTVVPWPDLPESSEPASVATSAAEAGSLPEMLALWPLPDEPYWTFLAACRRNLTNRTYKDVHGLYVDTYVRVTKWFETLGGSGHEMTSDSAVDCLRVLIDEHVRFDRVEVVKRAVQAAFHVHGWFLDLDDKAIQTGLIRFPPATVDPNEYLRLRAYREPTRAATVALYLAGALPMDIRNTTVDDLAQWRHDPSLPVAGVQVPDEAAPYLRAVLLARAVDGHRSDDPAFPGDNRRVLLDIKQAAKDLALNIGDGKVMDAETFFERRLPARAVTLERFDK